MPSARTSRPSPGSRRPARRGSRRRGIVIASRGSGVPACGPGVCSNAALGVKSIATRSPSTYASSARACASVCPSRSMSAANASRYRSTSAGSSPASARTTASSALSCRRPVRRRLAEHDGDPTARAQVGEELAAPGSPRRTASRAAGPAARGTRTRGRSTARSAASRDAATIETPPCTKAALASSSKGAGTATLTKWMVAAPAAGASPSWVRGPPALPAPERPDPVALLPSFKVVSPHLEGRRT